MRSLFSFEQFETVLQKIAHEIAIKAVTNPKGDIRITTHNGKLDTVETVDFMIRFYAKHISYSECHSVRSRYFKDSWSRETIWGFDVEEKLYTSSNHSTKISYYGSEGKDKETLEKVSQFIDKIMAEASMKPVPRFTLKNSID